MSNISSQSELHQAIQSFNPFSKAGIVREQNIWGRGFPDVSSLNAHASNTVFEALQTVQQREDHKVVSLTFTAQHGVGKSHLISRIRRQLQQQENIAFIYANGHKYTDLNISQYQFQQNIADSLSRTGNQNVMQWQEIATAMFNEIAKTPKTPLLLTQQFDYAYAKSLKDGKNLMDIICQKLRRIIPSIDPYVLRAILWTLSEKASSYGIKWLAGQELEPRHAQLLGLPDNLNKSNQEREAEALTTIQQIFKIVSHYQSVVICFDEMDPDDHFSDDGFTKAQVMAILTKRLYDLLDQDTGQGVVIISVMFPDTWRNSLDEISVGTSFPSLADRLSTYTQRKPIELDAVNADSMVELVSLWLRLFYTRKNLVPPHPFYPFEEEQLRQYAKVNRPTVREALYWCAENFTVGEETLPTDPHERFKLAWKREQEEDFGDFLEDNELLGEALRFGFSTLIGETIEGETSSGEKIHQAVIEGIEDVTPKSKNNGWINFKLVGKEQEKVFKIGVAVLQHNHGLSVGAGMNRLIDYETFDLTRGCLIRSQDKHIKKNWDSFGYLNQLVHELGGEWVNLQEHEVKPLVQLYSLYEQKERYQLIEEQFIGYAKQITLKNDLLLEVLSAPSGDIKADTIDDINVDDLFVVDPEKPPETPDDPDPFFPSDDESIEEKNKVNLSQSSQSKVSVDNPETDSQQVEPESEKLWFEKTYTGTKIKAFVFENTNYDVNSWKDFLITICTLMKLHHNQDFTSIFMLNINLKGRKRTYFSRNIDELSRGEKISGTNIYVETNLSSQQIVKFSHKILNFFNYPDDSVSIILEDE